MTISQRSIGHGSANRATPLPQRTGADPIATGLQRLFAPLAAEPIPDEFLALLDRIDANARAASAESPAEPAGTKAAK